MKLNILFQDGMVLQRDKNIVISGTGRGTLKVSFAGKEMSFESRSDKFAFDMGSFPAGGPFDMELSLDGEQRTIKNVAVGDVYLFSGQSNVQFTVAESDITKEEKTVDADLRFFMVERLEASETPYDGWYPVAADNIDHWSALGFLTGKLLREKCGVAVGIIVCCQGASVVQSWIPEDCQPELGLTAEQLHGDHTYYAEFNAPGLMYKKMMSRIIHFAIRDIIWYQGESNRSVAEAAVYDKMLAVLFAVFRRDFDNPCLPIVIVEIHAFDCDAEAWEDVRAAQRRAAKDIPYCVLCPSDGIAPDKDIHPSNKRPLAARVAAAILSDFKA